MNTEWKLVNALRDSLLWTASSLAAIGKEQDVITLEGRKRTVGEILDEANEALNVPDDAAPTSHPIPTGATGERDWELSCDECNGSGHVFVKHQVAERKTDVQEFKEECEACEGRGFNIAFEDIPGIAEYVKSCRPAATVATRADGRSATYGMTLGERIAHVGGRTNAQSYTEFGSPMAVNALIQHVLRDLDWTRQDDDGAYQARYRLPGGGWSSWGHVVCGVKGHEQELRYLPGERRPSPAAGDALVATTLLPRLQSLLDRMANDPRTGAMFEADGDTLRDAMHLCQSVKVNAAIAQQKEAGNQGK